MTHQLAEKIKRLIEATGPISVAEYMHICMSDPEYGYYQSQTVFGEDGDFITAPEISQMFGELIGIWCMEKWILLGEPDPFNLVEFGPGRGKLMTDLLRAGRSNPRFLAAATIQLIESSQSLREIQQKALQSVEKEIAWVDELDGLSSDPTIVIANEFLDVLPIRQYVRRNEGWHERLIGLDEHDELFFCLSPASLPSAPFENVLGSVKNGTVFEASPSREATLQIICQHLRNSSGVGLFIDYGHDRSRYGETLQAVRNHQFCELLMDPGTCDLSSHVDFGALRLVAEGEHMNVDDLTTQGEFLLGLGLLERAGRLGADQSPAVQARLQREVERLAGPNQMGDLFKVLSVSYGQKGTRPIENLN